MFFTTVFADGLSDNKSSQVSMTLLSIQTDHNNPVVWMISTGALISNYSSPFTKSLGIVSSAPITIGITVTFMMWPWCNGYRRRKWTRRHEFKSWTRLIAFHIALIPLGKVWIQLFSLQLWVNSRADKVFQPWWGN